MRKKHTLKICRKHLEHLELNKNGIAGAAIEFRPPVQYLSLSLVLCHPLTCAACEGPLHNQTNEPVIKPELIPKTGNE